MAKTETPVSNLKINRGTLANIEANLSSIGENELIITTDKNIPTPAIADSGKVVKVNGRGEYELGNVSGVGYTAYVSGTPTVQSNPLKFVQLTQTDYDNLQSVDADTFYIITGSNS